MAYTNLNKFYSNYPYPCVDLLSNTVFINPYIPKKKVNCSHKYSITKAEYKLILHTYFKHVRQTLLEGNEFKIPARMGSLRFKKYKAKFVDWKKSKELGKTVLLKNPQTSNYKSYLDWNRVTNAMKYMFHWHIKTVAEFNLHKGRYLREDFSRMLKYNDK